jgi:hypothetical protein
MTVVNERVAEIGKRANALRKAGFYSAEEVKWFAGYVRQPGTLLIECELLMVNAEQIVKREKEEAA